MYLTRSGSVHPRLLPWGRTSRLSLRQDGARQFDYRRGKLIGDPPPPPPPPPPQPGSSSEHKIPVPIQYNQVFPSDHLIDQDSPPIQTSFSLLGRLTIKVARNKGPPTSLSEAFLEEENLGLKDLKRIVGREVVGVHTHPRQLHPNEPRVGFQKGPMLKSGLQTRILALRDASWYQAEFSVHLCYSLMSNTSALLFLAVCIRRSWASFRRMKYL